MILPPRCFTCNAVVADLWEPYCANKEHYLEQGLTELEATNKALADIGLEDKRQYCCRRMILGHVPIIDRLLQYTPKEKPASVVIAKGKKKAAQVQPDNPESETEEPIVEDDDLDPDSDVDDENVYDRPALERGMDEYYDTYEADGGDDDYE
jgi:DNA-directed RNA polymerase I, II, and III subunit RPABC5